ncbi:hypothetical protein ACIBFB_00050 [Nocardiopsis sp. NPDC050513]|uniref:hypothetical protein n=1 Tax=Nocardiopsis sp. NPDC050513 TaxID=3364338 RepID=UPI003790A314
MTADTVLLGDAPQSLPEALGVPALTSPVIDGRNAVFHGRDLDTAAVARELAKHPDVRVVYLYADTVTVSGDPAVSLKRGSGWQVIAREVTASAAAPLTMDNGTQLTLYTGRITNPDTPGALYVRIPGKNGTWQDRHPTLEGRPGINLEVDDDALTVTAQNTVPLPVSGGPVQLGLSLTLLFQVATQVWASERDKAVAQLRWVVHLASQSTDLREVFAQASSLVTLHDSDRLHGRYVPRLDRSVYGTLVEAYKDAVAAYENGYVVLRNKTTGAKERVEAAKLLLASLRDTHTYHTQLARQAHANADAAAETLAQSRRNLENQRDRVKLAEIGFQGEMERFRQKQIEAAVVNGGLAVLSLGLAVASGAMGAFSAPNAIGQLVKTIDTAKSIVEAAGKIDQIMKDLQAALRLLDQLRKLEAQMGKNAADLSKLPVKEIDRLLRETADSGAVNSSAKWEEFQVVVRAMFGHMVAKAGVGAEYQTALEGLSIYGRAFVAAQAGYVQAAQRLIRATLQEGLTRRSVDRLEGYIADLERGEALSDAAAQAFYQGYLDQKRWLFVALENYGRAYRYWALAEPSVTPTMAGDAAHIAKQIAEIAAEYARALNGFRPPPQTMVKDFAITEGLGSIRDEEVLEVPITLDHPVFTKLERVRLKTIRVYLVGAKPRDGQSITVGIHSSGLYQDRFRRKEFRFSSLPAERAFEYKPGRDKPEIVIDGTIEEEFGKLLMQPNPFTQWQFTVRRENNPGLDLSGLSQVRIEMVGSAIRPGS